MKINTDDVVLASGGDKEAFGRIYDAVATDLYRFALYTLGNPQDAEDVVSETFIEAYKSIPTLRKPESFKPWIMRIVSIRCKRRIAGYIQTRNQTQPEPLEEPATNDDGHTLRAELQLALDALKPDEREVVVLSVLGGYTAREIAQILACPQGTVSSKLHRSLKKLKTMLE